MNKYRIIDLFCGCGGLSVGFHLTERFTTEFGVELLPHPSRAFVANIKNSKDLPTRVFSDDIRKLSNDEELFLKELEEAGIDDINDIDVVAGGPPCNGFSRNGVRKYEDNGRDVRFYDDERNHLYKDFLTFCDRIRPKVILVENVREFLNFGGGKFSKDLISKFDEMGYEVSYKKLCATDFGVPQKRHRVFFIAIRRDVCALTGHSPSFPEPLFFDGPDDLFSNERKYRTVQDAISDLPMPTTERGLIGLNYNTTDVSEFAKQMRSTDGIVYNHNARILSEKQVARINAVGTGRMKRIDPALQTKKFYGSAYRRLAWDEPSLTITTWVYHVGSGRFAHPDEDRGVTMREAARLQSFPDSFVFPAVVNPTSQMIGNAVPPLLAKALAEKIVSVLDTYSKVGSAA